MALEQAAKRRVGSELRKSLAGSEAVSLSRAWNASIKTALVIWVAIHDSVHIVVATTNQKACCMLTKNSCRCTG